MSSTERANYFELFGLQPNFNLDLPTLEANYIKLQQHIHPDNFAAADDLQRNLAAAQTARINQGYAILLDPVKRARYLLLLCAGVDALGEQTINNSAFLMEQMEWREALEGVHTKQEADSMTDAIEAKLDECSTQFAQIWEGLMPTQTEHQTTPSQDQAAPPATQQTQLTQSGLLTQEQTEELAGLVQRMQYLAKLKNELSKRNLVAEKE